ncbi:hypothetical protein [Pseudomonas laurentiana]
MPMFLRGDKENIAGQPLVGFCVRRLKLWAQRSINYAWEKFPRKEKKKLKTRFPT